MRPSKFANESMRIMKRQIQRGALRMGRALRRGTHKGWSKLSSRLANIRGNRTKSNVRYGAPTPRNLSALGLTQHNKPTTHHSVMGNFSRSAGASFATADPTTLKETPRPRPNFDTTSVVSASTTGDTAPATPRTDSDSKVSDDASTTATDAEPEVEESVEDLEVEQRTKELDKEIEDIRTERKNRQEAEQKLNDMIKQREKELKNQEARAKELKKQKQPNDIMKIKARMTKKHLQALRNEGTTPESIRSREEFESVLTQTLQKPATPQVEQLDRQIEAQDKLARKNLREASKLKGRSRGTIAKKAQKDLARAEKNLRQAVAQSERILVARAKRNLYIRTNAEHLRKKHPTMSHQDIANQAETDALQQLEQWILTGKEPSRFHTPSDARIAPDQPAPAPDSSESPVSAQQPASRPAPSKDQMIRTLRAHLDTMRTQKLTPKPPAGPPPRPGTARTGVPSGPPPKGPPPAPPGFQPRGGAPRPPQTPPPTLSPRPQTARPGSRPAPPKGPSPRQRAMTKLVGLVSDPSTSADEVKKQEVQQLVTQLTQGASKEDQENITRLTDAILTTPLVPDTTLEPASPPAPDDPPAPVQLRQQPQTARAATSKNPPPPPLSAFARENHARIQASGVRPKPQQPQSSPKQQALEGLRHQRDSINYALRTDNPIIPSAARTISTTIMNHANALRSEDLSTTEKQEVAQSIELLLDVIDLDDSKEVECQTLLAAFQPQQAAPTQSRIPTLNFGRTNARVAPQPTPTQPSAPTPPQQPQFTQPRANAATTPQTERPTPPPPTLSEFHAAQQLSPRRPATTRVAKQESDPKSDAISNIRRQMTLIRLADTTDQQIANSGRKILVSAKALSTMPLGEQERTHIGIAISQTIDSLEGIRGDHDAVIDELKDLEGSFIPELASRRKSPSKSAPTPPPAAPQPQPEQPPYDRLALQRLKAGLADADDSSGETTIAARIMTFTEGLQELGDQEVTELRQAAIQVLEDRQDEIAEELKLEGANGIGAMRFNSSIIMNKLHELSPERQRAVLTHMKEAVEGRLRRVTEDLGNIEKEDLKPADKSRKVTAKQGQVERYTERKTWVDRQLRTLAA